MQTRGGPVATRSVAQAKRCLSLCLTCLTASPTSSAFCEVEVLIKEYTVTQTFSGCSLYPHHWRFYCLLGSVCQASGFWIYQYKDPAQQIATHLPNSTSLHHPEYLRMLSLLCYPSDSKCWGQTAACRCSWARPMMSCSPRLP